MFWQLKVTIFGFARARLTILKLYVGLQQCAYLFFSLFNNRQTCEMVIIIANLVLYFLKKHCIDFEDDLNHNTRDIYQKVCTMENGAAET
jgi:hypothetical protein